MDHFNPTKSEMRPSYTLIGRQTPGAPSPGPFIMAEDATVPSGTVGDVGSGRCSLCSDDIKKSQRTLPSPSKRSLSLPTPAAASVSLEWFSTDVSSPENQVLKILCLMIHVVAEHDGAGVWEVDRCRWIQKKPDQGNSSNRSRC